VYSDEEVFPIRRQPPLDTMEELFDVL